MDFFWGGDLRMLGDFWFPSHFAVSNQIMLMPVTIPWCKSLNSFPVASLTNFSDRLGPSYGC